MCDLLPRPRLAPCQRLSGLRSTAIGLEQVVLDRIEGCNDFFHGLVAIARLLGGHVIQRPQGHARSGQVPVAGDVAGHVDAGQPQTNYLYRPLLVDQDVAWFDVAVVDAARMRVRISAASTNVGLGTAASNSAEVAADQAPVGGRREVDRSTSTFSGPRSAMLMVPSPLMSAVGLQSRSV